MPAPRLLLPVAAAVLVLAGVVVLLLRGGADDDAATAVLRAFAADWSSGDDEAAAARTDRARPALAALRASRAGLDGATVHVRAGAPDPETGKATLTVRWWVPGFGRFAYDAPVQVRRTGNGPWRVRWRPTVVHPRLSSTTRLGTTVDVPVRAPILDRDDTGLVRERPVVDVAVAVDRVRDPASTASRLAQTLDVGLDAGTLAKRIRAAPRGRFLPVLTLRRPAFARVSKALRAIPGVSLNPTTRPLAPSPDFARALLGTVGPATAEQVRAARGRDLAPGALVGQSGLSASHDAQLAGAPSRRVVVRDTGAGEVVATLARRRGTRPRALRTTLDARVQRAGETALAGVDGNAALVAVQPSTGDVLAVVNRPGGSTYDRALTGRYPPGSTWKVVTTTALLQGGLDPAQTVPCPPTRTVDGRAFRNFEGGAAGAVPFRTDFARSCNTAFVGLAGRLEPDTLPRVARLFGVGRRARPGAAVADGSVPPATGPVSQASMTIGQDRILVSPLALAGMAAAVQEGRWRAPRILRGAPRTAGPPIPEAATLRALMREVVTNGTGTALDGLPGEPIGKSGTAEFGGGDPPPTHAWFVGARGDVAVSVLVEGGSSGGRVAAPLAAAFYRALDA